MCVILQDLLILPDLFLTQLPIVIVYMVYDEPVATNMQFELSYSWSASILNKSLGNLFRQ